MARMFRREALALGGLGLPFIISGCLQAPGGGDGSSADRISVTVIVREDQPDISVEYDVELVDSVATNEHPARLRISITNRSDGPVVLGEERDVQFHHIESTDKSLYLHPAEDEIWVGPVEPGCWQLTEYVAVPEYYGTVSISSGETLRADSYVYGHPELPRGTCLPTGDYRLETTGIAGDDEEAIHDESDVIEFQWGFTLRVAE